MNDYAEQQWRDSNGRMHDTKEEALLTSRAHEVSERMKTRYVCGQGEQRSHAIYGLGWFLEDPENIIAYYRKLCEEVDAQMQEEAEGRD